MQQKRDEIEQFSIEIEKTKKELEEKDTESSDEEQVIVEKKELVWTFF